MLGWKTIILVIRADFSFSEKFQPEKFPQNLIRFLLKPYFLGLIVPEPLHCQAVRIFTKP